MKAKVKATGEIIDVDYIVAGEYCEIVFFVDRNNTHKQYSKYEVTLNTEGVSEPSTPIDWNAKLIELSGMAMQGCCANQELTECSDKHIARVSILQAKELIKQLKEEIK